jgi:hypothetical protein
MFKDVVAGQVDVSGIVAANQSVNRSKYCKRPEWVLLARYPKYINWGCGAFKVADIPTPIEIEIKPDEKLRYDFRPKHEPELYNYSHSEIKVYKRQEYEKPLSRKQVAKTVKLDFRMRLSRKILIIEQPKDQNNP